MQADVIDRVISGDEDYISRLPVEILQMIAVDYLSGRSILNLCQTSSYFEQVICGDQDIWRYLFRRDISKFVKSEDYRTEYAMVFNELQRRYHPISYAAYYGYEILFNQLYDSADAKALSLGIEYAASENRTWIIELALKRDTLTTIAY